MSWMISCTRSAGVTEPEAEVLAADDEPVASYGGGAAAAAGFACPGGGGGVRRLDFGCTASALSLRATIASVAVASRASGRSWP